MTAKEAKELANKVMVDPNPPYLQEALNEIKRVANDGYYSFLFNARPLSPAIRYRLKDLGYEVSLDGNSWVVFW